MNTGDIVTAASVAAVPVSVVLLRSACLPCPGTSKGSLGVTRVVIITSSAEFIFYLDRLRGEKNMYMKLIMAHQLQGVDPAKKRRVPTHESADPRQSE
jgi:hypothetical protein